MADFDGSKFLSLDNATLSGRTDTGLLPDGTLQIRHPSIAVGSVNEAVTWIKANRLTLDGTTTAFSVQHNSFDDKWRLGAISQTVNEKDREFVTLVVNYSRIYDTTLVWENARILSGEDGSEGDKFQSVEFKNLDRDQVPALLASERGKTYASGFTVGAGPAVTGEWVVLAASHRWDEDGSGIIVLHLGDPEFTLTGFRNFGLPNHQEVIWLWNIPKKDAQAVINGYMDEGYSASAQHSLAGDIPGTVDITVTNNNVTSTEIDVLGIGTTCDVSTSTYHRFGLTTSEAQAFADGFSDKEDGVTKSVRLSYDGRTGKYRALATVSTRDMDTQRHTSIIADSEHTTTTSYREWGVSKDGLEQFLQSPDWSKGDPRTSKRLSLNRNQDCSFDIVATSTLVDKLNTSFLHGTKHAQQSFDYHFQCSEAEKDAILSQLENDDTITGRRDVRVSRTSSDTYQVTISIAKEKRASMSFSWSAGTIVNEIKIRFGIEEEDAFSEILALPADSANYRISLSRGGDGTYDLVIRSTIDPGDELVGTIGNIANQDSYEFKFGVDNGDVTAAFNAMGNDSTRVDKSIRLRRNFDGKYDLTTVKSEVKDYVANWPIAIGSNFVAREARHWGKAVEDIPGLNFTQGEEKTIAASRDRQGNFTFAERTRTTTPWRSRVFVIGVTSKSVRVSQIFRNCHSVPTLPVGSRGQISVDYDEATDTYSGTATWFTIQILSRKDKPNEFSNRRIDYSVENHVWRRASDGRPALWKQPIDISILQTLDLVNAQAHVKGGMDGSSVRWTGSGYRSVRMTTKEPVPLEGKWIPGAAP